jgi:hypothetical protein
MPSYPIAMVTYFAAFAVLLGLAVYGTLVLLLLRISSSLKDLAWQMKESNHLLQEISYVVGKHDSSPSRHGEGF